MTTTEPRLDLRPPGLNADEKTTLLTFLDYLRESVLAKADGIPEPAVRTTGVPSGTSLLQLLKHLKAVELNRFVWAYTGADSERWEDEGAVSADDTASDLADAYREAIAQANEVALACTDLDRPGARSLRETPPPSMRWGAGPHDRGDRPARRSRGHPARADRWLDRAVMRVRSVRCDRTDHQSCEPLARCAAWTRVATVCESGAALNSPPWL
ncbi:Protein of unknown function [Streptomyces sp. 2323.1]|uniref:mycothiol transferase n=1 Tax=Streptomyces sp. 2323.1 TaxID=1938841 RepID=UPI000BC0E8D6|nr:Protein of unknown function [Streptomyces sp. 2323.1]